MKRDGRKLDHRTLETIRRMAIERVREGEAPSQVIASYGFHRSVIYRWLKTAAGRGHGLRALASHPITGRPPPETDRTPSEAGMPLDRWALADGTWLRHRAVDTGPGAGLGAEQIGITLSLSSIGTLLARLGLTVQKPLQRAYQRDPAAIERWQRETYPALMLRAREEEADILFWDESGFRADAVQGRTWGVKGRTPVVAVPGQRQSISAASAVSMKGGFWFAIYIGALNSELFVELLRKLMHRRRKPLHLVIDGPPAHKKAVVKTYVASTQDKLTLHFLPGYAPDLNPDELVCSHAQRTGNARRPLQKGETLQERVHDQLADIGKHSALVRSFFKHPSVAYISGIM